MLQRVLHDGGFGFFTQTALVLFCLSFAVILLVTFIRPRSLNERYARMPLADDDDTQPITPAPTRANGAENHE